MKKSISRIQLRPLIISSLAFLLLILANNTSPFFAAQAQGNPNNPIVYQTDFDNLTLGRTQFPPVLGQGGWYSQLAVGDAYGEIQNQISLFGNSLHQHTGASVPPHLQTIDSINLSRQLNGQGIITLSADFYATTSNLESTNSFYARLLAAGGPHPGYEIINFVLGAGNGTPKNVTGVSVGLPTYSPQANNIVPIPLTVGQNLSWNTWHNVKVVIDQTNDTYRSITVNGVKQDLIGYKPYRNTLDGINWIRGQQIDKLEASLVPLDGGLRTDDDIYWDNIQLRVTPK
jgi:hypothetical protein